MVVKYGGAAMQSKELKAAVIRDICLLATVGINMVLVHGGGPEINKMLEVVGIEPTLRTVASDRRRDDGGGGDGVDWESE